MLRRLFILAALCAMTGCVRVVDTAHETERSAGVDHDFFSSLFEGKSERAWRTVVCAYPVAQCAEPGQEQRLYDALRTYFLRRRCTLVLPDSGGTVQALSVGACQSLIALTIRSYTVTDTMLSPRGQSAALTVRVAYTLRITSDTVSVLNGVASASRPKPRFQQDYGYVVRRCADAVHRDIARDTYRALIEHERSQCAARAGSQEASAPPEVSCCTETA